MFIGHLVWHDIPQDSHVGTILFRPIVQIWN